MALHPDFPTSPCAPRVPTRRWFPAAEERRSTAYEKLLPPLVAKVRQEVFAWRGKGYPDASQTSVVLLRHWFQTDLLNEKINGLKLIYIDPPFDVGADFSMDIEIGGETFNKEPNLLEPIACRDTWGRGADSFIAMIYELRHHSLN